MWVKKVKPVVWLGGGVVAAVALLGRASIGTGHPGFIALPRDAAPVSVEPAELKLGSVAPGGAARGKLYLQLGPSLDSCQIEEITSSCSCIKIVPTRLMLRRGAIGQVEIEYSGNEEPEFRGTLNIEIEGYDAARVSKFRTKVQIKVENKE